MKHVDTNAPVILKMAVFDAERQRACRDIDGLRSVGIVALSFHDPIRLALVSSSNLSLGHATMRSKARGSWNVKLMTAALYTIYGAHDACQIISPQGLTASR